MSLNLSKNVLFRFDDVRLIDGVCVGDDGIGKVILGVAGESIVFGFGKF